MLRSSLFVLFQWLIEESVFAIEKENKTFEESIRDEYKDYENVLVPFFREKNEEIRGIMNASNSEEEKIECFNEFCEKNKSMLPSLYMFHYALSSGGSKKEERKKLLDFTATIRLFKIYRLLKAIGFEKSSAYFKEGSNKNFGLSPEKTGRYFLSIKRLEKILQESEIEKNINGLLTSELNLFLEKNEKVLIEDGEKILLSMKEVERQIVSLLKNVNEEKRERISVLTHHSALYPFYKKAASLGGLQKEGIALIVTLIVDYVNSSLNKWRIAQVRYGFQKIVEMVSAFIEGKENLEAQNQFFLELKGVIASQKNGVSYTQTLNLLQLLLVEENAQKNRMTEMLFFASLRAVSNFVLIALSSPSVMFAWLQNEGKAHSEDITQLSTIFHREGIKNREIEGFFQKVNTVNPLFTPPDIKILSVFRQQKKLLQSLEIAGEEWRCQKNSRVGKNQKLSVDEALLQKVWTIFIYCKNYHENILYLFRKAAKKNSPGTSKIDAENFKRTYRTYQKLFMERKKNELVTMDSLRGIFMTYRQYGEFKFFEEATRNWHCYLNKVSEAAHADCYHLLTSVVGLRGKNPVFFKKETVNQQRFNHLFWGKELVYFYADLVLTNESHEKVGRLLLAILDDYFNAPIATEALYSKEYALKGIVDIFSEMLKDEKGLEKHVELIQMALWSETTVNVDKSLEEAEKILPEDKADICYQS